MTGDQQSDGESRHGQEEGDQAHRARLRLKHAFVGFAMSHQAWPPSAAVETAIIGGRFECGCPPCARRILCMGGAPWWTNRLSRIVRSAERRPQLGLVGRMIHAPSASRRRAFVGCP
jgi:hypothetical protein